MKQLIFFFTILISLSSFGNTIQPDNQYIVIRDLNIRSETNTYASEILDVLRKNDTITIDSLGNEWSKITYEKKQAYVSTNFLKKIDPKAKEKDLISKQNKKIFFILLSITFIGYLIGLYKSHKNTIVVINGYLDFLLLCVPLILIVLIIICVEFFKMFSDNKELVKNVFLILSSLSLIATFIISVISNKGNIFNIIISIISKIFVILLMVLILFLSLMSSGAKKDGRFKDGTKNNGDTKWRLFIAGIASFTIYKLIK